MRAWLERENPAGEAIALPEGSGLLIFGRSSKCTLVFDDARLSARHCELSLDGGFWRLRDLGSELGTQINGLGLTHPRALFEGDLIQFGSVSLRFRTDVPAEVPQILKAITEHPGDETAWLVYADFLLEQGDPLGERISRAHAGGRLDHLPWMGALWDVFVSGELEVEWHLGFISRATLRTTAGRLPMDWKDALCQLLNLRIGHFVQSLVIDLPRLENLESPAISEALASAQHFLAQLPALPETLEHVSLGYEADSSSPPVETGSELVLRRPRLQGTPVYQRANGLHLKLVQKAPGTSLVGLETSRPLSGVTRIRRGGPDQLIIESPPGIPLIASGNPCFFSFTNGRAQLVAGKMRGEVRVNNRIDALYQLLPNDVIDVSGAARFQLCL